MGNPTAREAASDPQAERFRGLPAAPTYGRSHSV